MKRMGQHVKVDVTALRTYEGFARGCERAPSKIISSYLNLFQKVE